MFESSINKNLCCKNLAQRSHEVKGRVWPDGHFGVSVSRKGYEPRKRPSLGQYRWIVGIGGVHIGLSSPSNSHSDNVRVRKPRGSGGLTTYGKRMVSSSGFLLEQRYGKSRLSFATLTCPSVSKDEGWLLSTNWAEIVRVFFQKLTRVLGRRGLPKLYCSVTELQPERSEREMHPALHLHFLFVGRKAGGGWKIRPYELREMWKEVLGSYLDGERDYSAVENVARVKGDAAGYLAKYMSKGSSTDEFTEQIEGDVTLPKAWYNIAAAIKKKVKSRTIRNPEILREILQTCEGESAEEAFRRYSPFWIETPQGFKILAYYGTLHKKDNETLQAMAEASPMSIRKYGSLTARDRMSLIGNYGGATDAT